VNSNYVVGQIELSYQKTCYPWSQRYLKKKPKLFFELEFRFVMHCQPIIGVEISLDALVEPKKNQFFLNLMLGLSCVTNLFSMLKLAQR
jgi:hypothetical protein